MKKINISLIISILCAFIAVLSVYLNFVIYNESKAVVFKWKAFSRNDISLDLNRKEYKDKQGKITNDFYIPIWIQCKISNLGNRTFSVEAVWGIVLIEDKRVKKKRWSIVARFGIICTYYKL